MTFEEELGRALLRLAQSVQPGHAAGINFDGDLVVPPEQLLDGINRMADEAAQHECGEGEGIGMIAAFIDTGEDEPPIIQ